MVTMFNGIGCLIFLLTLSNSVAARDGFAIYSDTAITSLDITDDVLDNTAELVVIAKENTSEIVVAEAKTIKAIVTPELLFKQLHPLSVSFVREYNRKNEARFEKIADKNGQNFVMIDAILEKNEVPEYLKYLAIIESGLHSGAVSHKGAVGPWQFMAPTARLMGLTVNKHRDERRDLTKSTYAAAKYLKVLYKQFNDWNLTIAAYNSGAGRVEYAIRKSGSRDFWKLQHHLPAETRGHVKKFIATRYYFEAKEAKRNITPPLLNVERFSSDDVDASAIISGKYRAAALARILDMEPVLFDTYNPGFDAEVAVNGYQLRLPKDKMELFTSKKHEILAESIQMMLNESTSIISADTQREYPKAIEVVKPKAVTGDNGSRKKR